MIRYLIRRVAWGLGVLLVLTAFTFALFGPILQEAKGTSAADTICGARCTPERIQATRAYLGLDEPWYRQYRHYLGRLMLGPDKSDDASECPRVNGRYVPDCGAYVGRLGTTFVRDRSVDRVVGSALGTTISLTVAALLIWLAVSIPLGVLSAARPRSILDRSILVIVLCGQALPVYYVSLLVLYAFAFWPNSTSFERAFGFRLDLFPLSGYSPFSLEDPWPWAWHLALPATTLAMQFAALYVRAIRSSMLTAMGADYIRTAQAKGATPLRVVVRHALRNALLPIVTMVGMDAGTLLGGAIIVEYTFGLPGIGHASVDGVADLDVPLVSGIVLVAGAAIVLANLVVDLLYAFVDPRVGLT